MGKTERSAARWGALVHQSYDPEGGRPSFSFFCRLFADHGGVPPKVLSSQSDFLPGVDSRPSDAESLEMTAALASSLVQVATRDKVTSRGQGTFYGVFSFQDYFADV